MSSAASPASCMYSYSTTDLRSYDVHTELHKYRITLCRLEGNLAFDIHEITNALTNLQYSGGEGSLISVNSSLPSSFFSSQMCGSADLLGCMVAQPGASGEFCCLCGRPVISLM